MSSPWRPACVATTPFRDTHPQWFGTLGGSLSPLFQIVTLESWSMGIVRPVMDTPPWACGLFIPLLGIATFPMRRPPSGETRRR